MSILVVELGRVWADVYDLYNSTMMQIREIWHDNGMPWAYIVIDLAWRANIVNFGNELCSREGYYLADCFRCSSNDEFIV